MKYENAQIKIAELADYFSGIHVHFSPYFFPLLLYFFLLLLLLFTDYYIKHTY